MRIRTARETDYDEIYRLVQIAFKTAQVSNGEEQDFVQRLRREERYLPELEFVAEERGILAGHIMFTKQAVKTEGGEVAGLLLAPLCVALPYRNQGVGGKLIRHGFADAAKLGYTAVFLVGNPDYYSRFGFRATGEFGIRNDSEIPDKFVQVCEITSGGLRGVCGSVRID